MGIFPFDMQVTGQPIDKLVEPALEPDSVGWTDPQTEKAFYSARLETGKDRLSCRLTDAEPVPQPETPSVVPS